MIFKHNLTNEDDLKEALEAIGPVDAWPEVERNWVRKLEDFLVAVRNSTTTERATLEFQTRLWERNPVSNIGQGNISMAGALNDEKFRNWLAEKSATAMPEEPEGRARFLNTLYEDIAAHLQPYLSGKMPHLKIFRVMAALYPEAMTSIAHTAKLKKVVQAMDGDVMSPPAAQHVWVRERIDSALGAEHQGPDEIATRMVLAWKIYALLNVVPDEQRTEQVASPAEEARLIPQPAGERLLGLTAVAGSFPSMLTTLKRTRNGVTKEELLEILRLTSPKFQR